jgi:hypothetical protein
VNASPFGVRLLRAAIISFVAMLIASMVSASKDGVIPLNNILT